MDSKKIAKPTNLYTRESLISQLESSQEWDLIIIGGGASGLGVAVDAASRGLKTLLLEQYDFAKGTSSKSTKLLHGGVRYLAQGHLGLVIEALEERGRLKKNAAHLFKKQEFIIPNYQWWKGPYYLFGLKMYDWLSKRLSLGASKWVSRKRVLKYLPTLKKEHLKNGVSYFDGQFDDARLALNLAQTAFELGALPLNYMKVKGFIKNDQDLITAVEVTDQETQKDYRISGKIIVNATGIFTDKILKLYKPEHKKTVIPSQGIHLMLDASFLNSDKAIMIPKTSDGRVLFIIPWHDKVIAGTTDTLIKKPKIEPVPLKEEVAFILETVNQYLNKEAKKEDVLSVFSGLRPLAKPKKEDTKTKEVSRNHKISVDGNLVSIVGGKWTTYRQIGEDVIDKVIKHFALQLPASSTDKISIHGNIRNSEKLPEYLRTYGSDIAKLEKLQKSNPVYQETLHPKYPYTKAQVVFAVREEFARTVEDFLSRRIRLTLLDVRAARACAPTVAEVMAKELKQTKEWEHSQIESYMTITEKYLLT